VLEKIVLVVVEVGMIHGEKMISTVHPAGVMLGISFGGMDLD